MRTQWRLTTALLLIFTVMGCASPTVPREDSDSDELAQDQNLDFNNGSSQNNNQNNNWFDTGDAGVMDATEMAQDAGSAIDEPGPEPEPEPEPSNGACDNDADEGELGSLDDTLDDVVGDCALSCLLSSDVATCGSDCVADNTDLSDDCSDCFGEIIACTASNCAFQCGLDAEGEACASCREENCNDDFEQCAGIPAQ